MKSYKESELKIYTFSIAVGPNLSTPYETNSQYFKLFLRWEKSKTSLIIRHNLVYVTILY